MKFKADQIAEILGGEIVGDENAEVYKLAKIEEGEVGALTFLSNPKYTEFIYDTKASIAIVNNDFIPEKEIDITLIKVPDAHKAFLMLLDFYNEAKNNKTGIEQPSHINDSATIGENLYLGAFAYISGNVKVGDNVKIFPNVYIEDNVVIGNNTTIYAGAKIMSETVIGNNCVINAGAVIGADGFGFAPNEEGVYKKVPQIGNVVIEDNVDVGAATTIDRATLGSTFIRKGVKLDNQIQVGHNVEIGRNTVIAAQTGIAGSSKIGQGCMLGGQVGVAGHLIIGNNVRIQAQSGIGRNIKDNEVIQGSPAFGYSDWNRSYVYFKKLPDLANKINQLEKELKALKNQNE